MRAVSSHMHTSQLLYDRRQPLQIVDICWDDASSIAIARVAHREPRGHLVEVALIRILDVLQEVLTEFLALEGVLAACEHIQLVVHKCDRIIERGRTRHRHSA